MKYILNEKMALRSWRLVPYAYYVKNDCLAKGLKKEMFGLLLQCDGETDIEDSETLEEAKKMGFILFKQEDSDLLGWR